MKRAIILLLLTLWTGMLSGQEREKNILGIRAGINIASYDLRAEDGWIKSGSRAGFHVAVRDQILLHRALPLYLETGIEFASRGGKTAVALRGDTYKMNMRPFYLQIPLLLGYHLRIGNWTFRPFAGIYGGLGIRGAMKTTDGSQDSFGKRGILSRGDFGVRAGAGIVFRRLTFDIGYDIGCRNQFRGGELFGHTLDPDILQVRNNSLLLLVGYNF